MGNTPASMQEQLSTVIAKQIIDVMSDNKFGAASAITEDVQMVSSGKGSKISGVNIKQVANINVTAFLSDSTAIELKSDLKSKIANAVKVEASNNPLGKDPDINTKIANVVDNSIEQKFSRTSMIELNNSVKLGVKMVAIDEGGIDNIKIDQRGDIIMNFASSVGLDIATKLISNTDIKNSTDTKTSDFITGTIKAVGDAISGIIGSVLTGVWAGPVMMFAMFIAVVLIGVYIIKGGGTQPAPMMSYAPPMAAPVGRDNLAALGINMAALPPVGGPR